VWASTHGSWQVSNGVVAVEVWVIVAAAHAVIIAVTIRIVGPAAIACAYKYRGTVAARGAVRTVADGASVVGVKVARTENQSADGCCEDE
jgi:hypothetical protein